MEDRMKAWELSGFGLQNLRQMERPVPKPAANELLVRIDAVSLNYRDKLIYDGIYNPNLRFPVVQGADAAGEVVETGKQVKRFRVGDQVVTHYATRWLDGEPQGYESEHTLGNTISGALTEFLALDEEAFVAKPEYLTSPEASTLPVAALTAWMALVEKGQLKAGQTVLIQGTGGVSIFGLQLATALGAKAIVTSSSDEKLARAKALGAVHGINYSRRPDWEEAVLELTGQKGVDHVLEVVGGDNLSRSITATKTGGQISVIGILRGITSTIELWRVLQKQVVLRGIGGAGHRRAFEDMNKALAKFQLRPVIDAVYPFTDTLSAYHHLERGAFGKVVIAVASCF
jgi:NADPH:quinone reductase-like Zn-dependent oxidoreductase